MAAELGSQDVILRLQKIIGECLAPYVDDRAFGLVDFPDHSNVGDSAIYLGELSYFNGIGRSPKYVCVHDGIDWGKLVTAVPNGPVFIHGGGNFGDIWPAHQKFRLEVLRRFRKRLVIQLPQSIQFQDESNIAETREVIAKHGSFILMVRDIVSLEFSKTHFDCATILCPDMAFCLGRQPPRGISFYDELYLLRTDLERVDFDRPIPTSTTLIADWLDEPRGLRRIIQMRTMLSSLLNGFAFDNAKLENEYFSALAKHRVERGIKMLSSGRHVTSDRLHAHILCTLLDIPHTVLDNNYRKIGRFIETWGTGWNGVTCKSDIRSAA